MCTKLKFQVSQGFVCEDKNKDFFFSNVDNSDTRIIDWNKRGAFKSQTL